MNIPLLLTIIINPLSKLKVGIINGLILNNLYSYRVTSYYSTKDPVVEKDVQASKGIFSFKTGVELSKAITQHMMINCSPFINVKLWPDPGARPGDIVIDDRGLTFGLKIGLEYRFFKE
jgi:hypothetical protein